MFINYNILQKDQMIYAFLLLLFLTFVQVFNSIPGKIRKGYKIIYQVTEIRLKILNVAVKATQLMYNNVSSSC